MAAPAREPSFELLGTRAVPWTAQLALDLLPDSTGPKVEVIGGSVFAVDPVDPVGPEA